MDKWFSKTYVIQIVAVAIAILLWTIVRLNNDAGTMTSPDMLERVPIQLRFDDSKFSAIYEPQYADVQLRGKSADLLKVRMSTYQIVADASRLSAGKHTITLTGLDFPAGIDVMIEPATIRVQLEKLRSKEFPVQVNVSGKPAEGFDYGAAQVKPSRVRVLGSAEQLKLIHSIQVDVDLQASSQNLSEQAEVQVLDQQGKLLSLSADPATVLVTVPIIRHVKVVPIKFQVDALPPSGYALSAITVAPKQVSIYGAKEKLRAIEQYDAIPLNLENYTSSQKLDISVPIIDDVAGVEPELIKVDLTIVPSETRKIRNVPIQFKGIEEGLQVALEQGGEAQMDLMIEGAPAVLNRLTGSQIRLQVNLAGFAAGNHQVPVEVVLPEWVRVAETISPMNIQLITKQ
jgi:YbbR domain-containing protein